jgi:hypothetical protein
MKAEDIGFFLDDEGGNDAELVADLVAFILWILVVVALLLVLEGNRDLLGRVLG